MIIRRIEVRNFRKLIGPIVIDALGPGLSVISGDNEEGKSTLLDCIRTAFFMKHNVTGGLAASLQPYSSIVRPEIRVDFDLDGQRYQLSKAFCQHPEAELLTPNGRFSGLSAEEELGRLLRFSLPKRMRKDGQREHEGVFGMFWVEQGKSTTLEPNDAGRASIVEALQKEVGDVLGGKRGQRLVTEVNRRREILLTAAGKPRGPFAQALQVRLNTEEELRRIEEQLAVHDLKTEELQRCRAKLHGHRQERSMELARERVQAAKAASEAVTQLQRDVQTAERDQQAAKGRHDLAAERAMQRTQAVERLGKAEKELEQLATSLETEQARVSALRSKVQAEDRDLVKVQAELNSAERELERAEAAGRLAQASADLMRLEQDKNGARESKRERDAALAIAASIVVDKKGLAEIRRLADAVTSARIRVESLATHVRIRVKAGAEVLLDEQPLTGEQDRTLTHTAVIRVPNCMEMSVSPGSEVRDPHAQLDTAIRSLSETMQQVGVASVADAEEQHERRIAAMNQAQTSAKLISAHAPNGLEDLDAQIVALGVEIERLETLTGTKRGQQGAAGDRQELARLRQHRDEVRIRVDSVRRKADQSHKELDEGVNTETAAAARHTHQEDLCIEYGRQLEVERNEVADSELDGKVLQAAQDLRSADTTLAAARRAVKEADPESVAQELRIAETALEHTEADIANLERKALSLESELRVSGGLGLGERKQELLSRFTDASAEVTRLERQANSLHLLWRVLLNAESAAKEQFLRPVTERVQPYLRMLLPGTELSFDEDICIVGLRRGKRVEPFQTLSIGTQEQIAVLTRLAFADLLREHGQPAVVLLDDAIVFADDQRFDRMLRILDKAAQNLQVIVLSCRERDYRASGAPVIRLADCSVEMHKA